MVEDGEGGEAKSQVQEELEELEDEVGGWREQVEREASRMRSEHARMLREAEQEHSRLNAEHERLASEEASARERVVSKRERVQQLREDVASTTDAGSHLPAELESLQRALDSESSDASAKESEVEAEKLRKDARLRAIIHAVELYKHRLALSFSSDPSDSSLLRMHMWHIDPSEPSKTFTFCLHVTSRSPSEFRILNVTPEVPHSRLMAVQAQLNHTQSLRSLAVNMRREFRLLAGVDDTDDDNDPDDKRRDDLGSEESGK